MNALQSMDSMDVVVLRHLRDWRLIGRRAVLVTATRTWGSSPRPVGSIMALGEDGSVVGSVSGGCIEDDLLDRFVHARDANAFRDGPPQPMTYGLTAEEAHRFGLPCGGTLELLVERNPEAGLLVELVAMVEQGSLVERRICMSDGRVSQDLAGSGAVPRPLDNGFANVFGPQFRLLIIGAGNLAAYLSTMAAFSGFRVTVCDPRAEYRKVWDGPTVEWMTDMPDDAVRAMRPDGRTCVVALTHDPKLDDLALLEALDSSCFYVGAIGSRRNAAARRQRLIEHFGQAAGSMAKLRAPIGIDIASRTPPEIAVSVMAEILAVKNGVEARRARRAEPLNFLEVQRGAIAKAVSSTDPGREDSGQWSGTFHPGS